MQPASCESSRWNRGRGLRCDTGAVSATTAKGMPENLSGFACWMHTSSMDGIMAQTANAKTSDPAALA